MLGAQNSSRKDEFYKRGSHENLDVYYISQSIRNNCGRLILFKETLTDVESMYEDIGGYDMTYDDFKEVCCEAWSEN